MNRNSGSFEDEAGQSYLAALGGFVLAFAAVENTLQRLLTSETGVTSNIARAIFSGVRVDQAKTFVKRARSVNGKDDDALVDRVFSHLSTINNVRNDILHFGPEELDFSDPENLQAVISNHRRAMPGKGYSYVVSEPELRHMFDDLMVINLALHHLSLDCHDRMKNDPELGGQFRRIIDSLEDAARQPWRYKSTPRSRSRQPNPDSAQDTQPPPRP